MDYSVETPRTHARIITALVCGVGVRDAISETGCRRCVNSTARTRDHVHDMSRETDRTLAFHFIIKLI